MGTLSRVRDFTADRDATPPIAISAQGIDDEFDQLVTESNAQDVRLDTLEAGGNVSTADLADDAVTPAKASFVDDSLAATDTHIMVADGTDFGNVAVSGDATLSNTGVLTIGSDKITTAKILDANITTAKIADANVTSAKLASNIDAAKLHDGTVSNTEFGYLNGATSSIQTQIDNVSAGAISTVKDNVFRVQDNSDNTKQTAIESSGITTGTTRTITMADQNIDLTPDTGSYASAGSGVSAGFAIAMSIAL